MKSIYKFLIAFGVIIFIILVVLSVFFGYILYTKYAYLWKVIRKMENDKYLWPLNKKICQGVAQNVDLNGNTLLIGVGSCSILDNLIKKQDSKSQIHVIDTNKYLLDLAEEKYGNRCKYIHEDFMYHKFDMNYDNVVSSLPHKEFSLNDIDRIFEQYFKVSQNKIIYFESKMPHIKNSYVKMVIENKNKGKKSEVNADEKIEDIWDLSVKKNYKNIPPVNLCILTKKIKQV
jgi:phospholipid N-methyltransferase